MAWAYTAADADLGTARSRKYFVDLERTELTVERPNHSFRNENELKEWIWENHKDKLISSMTIKFKDEQTDLERAQRRLALLDKIVRAQRQCLQNESPRVVFGSLLDSLLQLTNGEYGFIGETKYDQDGNIYLQTHAYTNIAWDSATQKLYQENAESGLAFTNHYPLFGRVLKTAEPVISNNLEQDHFACGTHEGHPAFKCILGIPFFKNGGVEMNGMLGIGKKLGGFTQEDIDFLEPFTATCSNLVYAYGQTQERKDLINTSKERVRVQTQELQLVNKNLEDANRRTLESSAAQMEHFACMSHEIRTPLNGIIGLSSLLQDTRLSAMQAESLTMIVNSGDLLLTVVNDVLDYSKLESGNVEIEIRRSNLQETLNSFVHSIETKAQAKQLTVRTFYDTALPEFVTTDSRRLQQIMYNLLGNAIKFSKEGSVVELHVTLCDAMSTSYSSHAKNEFETEQVIRFIVKDYGKGIAKKDFGRIFKPFQQASAETERVYGGTGLGLTITAKLANGLGGTIDVDSIEGEWSKFTVDLPFREKPAYIAAIAQRLQSTTILLVHKDTESLVQVKDYFRRYDVAFLHFINLDEMEARIVEQGFLVRARSYICLVDEDLYSPEPVELLSNLSKSILLTFGPSYSVKKTAGHYRSLVQVLPSVFFDSLGDHHESLTTRGRGLERGFSTTSMNSVPYKKLRVLIAEDNLINQKVLHRMLTRLGLKVIDIVGDGQNAVEREASHEYDIILMDMQMPVMDGTEACRLICSRQGGHPNARVVFVTAHASSSYVEECTKAGGIAFLPKPFNLRDVEKCFQNL
jgi:signal transduction histidine kinase/CheY-like chemotaxis protein